MAGLLEITLLTYVLALYSEDHTCLFLELGFRLGSCSYFLLFKGFEEGKSLGPQERREKGRYPLV
jgi:hypothetical protein